MATITDWGKYIGAGAFSDPNSAEAQAFLKQLQQYDPNAAYIQATTGEYGPITWQTQYDPGKLPTSSVTGTAGTFGIVPYQEGMKVNDPSKVYDDPVYGKVTTTDNLQHDSAFSGWLAKVGPAFVLGSAALGSGALSGLLGGGGGEAAASSGDSILGGLGPGGGMGVGGAELATPGIEAYFPGGILSGPVAQGFGPDVVGSDWASGLPSAMTSNTNPGLLSTLAGKAGDIGSALLKSGALGGGQGGGGLLNVGGGGGGGARAGGGGPWVIPGSPTEAELLNQMMRRQGLARFLDVGGGMTNG